MARLSFKLIGMVSLLAMAAVMPRLDESYTEFIQRPIKAAIASAQGPAEAYKPVLLPAELVSASDIARAMTDNGIAIRDGVHLRPYLVAQIADRMQSRTWVKRADAIAAAKRLLLLDAGLQIIQADASARRASDLVDPDITETSQEI